MAHSDRPHIAAGAILPPSLPPLGLNRAEAAAFIGIGVSLFDRLVEERRMPEPRVPSSGRLVWDVAELAEAFRNLPHRNRQLAPSQSSGNAWDDAD